MILCLHICGINFELLNQCSAFFITQEGVIKHIKEKEYEREIAEGQLSKYNLSRIDEKEKQMVKILFCAFIVFQNFSF